MNESLLNLLGLESPGDLFSLPGILTGKDTEAGQSALVTISSPVDGQVVAQTRGATPKQVNQAVERCHKAFLQFRNIPAPRRGELVRRIGLELRAQKKELGALVTLETGKIVQEAEGEVQEMIDICDFAAGLSRQLYGLTIATERPGHRLMEQWHPLGAIGIITAFNFPVAVWAWNAMLALVCGDSVIWKPSEKTPLCAIACHNILQRVLGTMKDLPQDLSCVVIGGTEAGKILTANRKVPLISATGSIPMGRAVAANVGARLGRSLLELGGNNAIIITPEANLELALRGAVFAAVGTCGQRCTSLRRLIVHKKILSEFLKRLKHAYKSLKIGDPNDADTLIGPLINETAFKDMQAALKQAKKEKAVITGGDRVIKGVPEGGFYVQPAIVEKLPLHSSLLREETFAPIVYILPYTELEEAIQIQNNVPQGLSSAIFTDHLQEAETFLSPSGSDCGIANVNIGTSGAEIGGAFGGEKDTGGGRESGSDAWKNYMRRQTVTVNYSKELPLAQGITFEIDPQNK